MWTWRPSVQGCSVWREERVATEILEGTPKSPWDQKDVQVPGPSGVGRASRKEHEVRKPGGHCLGIFSTVLPWKGRWGPERVAP